MCCGAGRGSHHYAGHHEHSGGHHACCCCGRGSGWGYGHSHRFAEPMWHHKWAGSMAHRSKIEHLEGLCEALAEQLEEVEQRLTELKKKEDDEKKKQQ